MGCQQEWPVSKCGYNGECTPLNNTVFCECSGGFSNLEELNFFIESKSNKALCLYHENLVTGLYVVCAVTALMNVALLSKAASTRSQRKRAFLWVLSDILTAVWAVYRIVNHDAFMADDIFFSFISVMIALAKITGAYIAIGKFLKYMQVRVARMINTSEKPSSSSILKRTVKFLVVSSYVVFQGIWVPTLLDSNRAKLVLFRCVMAYACLLHLSMVGLIHRGIAALESDLRDFIALRADGPFQSRSTSTSHSDSETEWIRQRLSQFQTMRKGIEFTGFVSVFITLSGVLFNYAFLLWTYLFPFHMILLNTYSFLNLFGQWKRKSKNTSESKPSRSAGASKYTSNYVSTKVDRSLVG
mmetsp:Transcript_1763/g.2034  ORF Transcript_1763/g.2034 Transcript_1763/m.2034 type:complete len:357 (+) Transcript_1763:460-1530(+)